jgi:hypothetical protein
MMAKYMNEVRELTEQPKPRNRLPTIKSSPVRAAPLEGIRERPPMLTTHDAMPSLVGVAREPAVPKSTNKGARQMASEFSRSQAVPSHSTPERPPTAMTHDNMARLKDMMRKSTKPKSINRSPRRVAPKFRREKGTVELPGAPVTMLGNMAKVMEMARKSTEPKSTKKGARQVAPELSRAKRAVKTSSTPPR